VSGEHVLPGKDGWLFLGEGTNFSISQMTGARTATPAVQMQWQRTLEMRARVFGERTVTVICPEKSAIYPQHLPDGHQLSEGRIAKVLERRAPRVVYALGDVEDTTDLYSKTDTHFTELGAHLTARRICDELGISYAAPAPEWTRRTILGDLGSAVDPQVRSEAVFMANAPQLEVRDNGLQNRGRVTRYVRDAGGPHVLIFGDSFSGISLARQVALLAGRVTFVHSLAFDYELVQRLQPDHVVGEVAERFLIEPPADGRSVVALLMEKHVQGLFTPTMIDAFKSTRSEFDDVYGPAGALVDELVA
jgi:hypothetical protein